MVIESVSQDSDQDELSDDVEELTNSEFTSRMRINTRNRTQRLNSLRNWMASVISSDTSDSCETSDSEEDSGSSCSGHSGGSGDDSDDEGDEEEDYSEYSEEYTDEEESFIDLSSNFGSDGWGCESDSECESCEHHEWFDDDDDDEPSIRMVQDTEVANGCHVLQKRVVKQLCCPSYRPQWFDVVDIIVENDIRTNSQTLDDYPFNGSLCSMTKCRTKEVKKMPWHQSYEAFAYSIIGCTPPETHNEGSISSFLMDQQYCQCPRHSSEYGDSDDEEKYDEGDDEEPDEEISCTGDINGEEFLDQSVQTETISSDITYVEGLLTDINHLITGMANVGSESSEITNETVSSCSLDSGSFRSLGGEDRNHDDVPTTNVNEKAFIESYDSNVYHSCTDDFDGSDCLSSSAK